MAQVTQSTIKISLPINEVYSFVTTMENMVYFWDKIKSVEKDPENPDAVGIGTKYNLIIPTVLGGKKTIPVEITKAMAHENFEYRDNSSPTGVLTGYFFTELPDGTQVSMYRKTNLSAIANLFSLNSLSSRDFKRELEKTLLRLKNHLEAQPEPPIEETV
jgi:uncharacterized membrane protein